MSHSHNHHSSLSGKKLFLAIALNLLITVLQILGGITSKSLALLSDAMHNFSDVLALIISYIAHKFAHKKFSFNKTFGYKRAEIMAALINSVSLLIIAFLLIKEAILRLSNPVKVDSFWVIILAIVSIFVNIFSVMLLHKDSKRSINIKSSYIHLLTDALTSFAVLIGGIFIYYFHIYIIDSILSFFISMFLVYSSISILSKTIEILMQFAPMGVDIKNISQEILKIKDIKNIHHIHIWQLNDNEVHLEAHIDFRKDIKLSKSNNIIKEISKILKDKFHISHIVLQQEYNVKDDKSLIVDKHNE